MLKSELAIGDYTKNLANSLKITSEVRYQMVFIMEELYEMKGYKI